MITYVDTSTLIKLFVDEPGSDAATLIWDTADTLTTIHLTLVEAHATLAAASRAGRITPSEHDAALVELDGLWASLAVVAVTGEIIDRACHLAESYALRGYDAVHLAAAVETRAEVLTSADAKLCAAAAELGINVANPLENEPAAPSSHEDSSDIQHFLTTAVHGPTAAMTDTSGIFGIPLPNNATPDPSRAGFVRTAGVGTIQDLVDFYRDWMAIDGWIFDADFGNSDPYAMEEQPFVGGYFAQLFFAKPTTPPTTVAIVIGNTDGRPGRKQDLTISIVQTPDDDLPRRSLRVD
jgi:predicted nucleic acid-binding protein